MKKESIIAVIGWVGLILLNFSTFPTIYYFLAGINTSLPQLSHLIIIVTGMSCFLIRSIHQKDKTLIFFTTIGLISHLILLIFSVTL